MKFELGSKTKRFTPVSITVTFETQDELDRWVQISNHDNPSLFFNCDRLYELMIELGANVDKYQSIELNITE